MEKAFVGIDIGKNGAIVVIYPGDNVKKYVTPKIGTEIDLWKFAAIIKEIKDYCASQHYKLHFAIEDVHSIFGTGAKANFQFGRSLGIVEGIICALDVNFEKIAPKTWQKVSCLGVPVIKKPGKGDRAGANDTKAMALIAAKRLYPNVDLTKSARAEKPHDGIVDSLLIAHYLKLKY